MRLWHHHQDHHHIISNGNESRSIWTPPQSHGCAVCAQGCWKEHPAGGSPASEINTKTKTGEGWRGGVGQQLLKLSSSQLDWKIAWKKCKLYNSLIWSVVALILWNYLQKVTTPKAKVTNTKNISKPALSFKSSPQHKMRTCKSIAFAEQHLIQILVSIFSVFNALWVTVPETY